LETPLGTPIAASKNQLGKKKIWVPKMSRKKAKFSQNQHNAGIKTFLWQRK